MFAFVAVTALSFVACNAKDGAKGTTADSTKVETAAPTPAAAPAEGNALAKYEEFVNKTIELYPKMKAGDVAATQEYTKLAQEMTAVSEQLSKDMATMSAADVAKFTELGKKMQEAMK